MSKTGAERKADHARSQQIHSKTEGFKTTREAWRCSPSGRQAVKRNNQVQRDKRRDALNHALAEEQQGIRDAEDKAKRIRAEAIALYGEEYVNNPSGVRKDRGKTT